MNELPLGGMVVPGTRTTSVLMWPQIEFRVRRRAATRDRPASAVITVVFPCRKELPPPQVWTNGETPSVALRFDKQTVLDAQPLGHKPPLVVPDLRVHLGDGAVAGQPGTDWPVIMHQAEQLFGPRMFPETRRLLHALQAFDDSTAKFGFQGDHVACMEFPDADDFWAVMRDIWRVAQVLVEPPADAQST